MVKALGLGMLVLGALLLLVPVAMAIWAFNSFSVGVSVESPVRLGLWLTFCVTLMGGGIVLLGRARHGRASTRPN